MNSKMLHRLAGEIFIAILGITSVIGCSSVVNPQSTPADTTTTHPTRTPPTPTATISAVNELQGQLDDTVQKFLDLNNRSSLNSTEAKELFSGELTDWDVPTVGKVKGAVDAIVFLDSSNAVVRIQIENGYIFDAYLYLSYDAQWRFTAIRAMALPGFARQMYVELSDKAELSPDEQSTLNEIKRMFLTDAEWRNFFLQNQSSFESLCAKAVQTPEVSFVSGDNISTYPAIQEEFISLSVSTLEREQIGNVQIVMDGMIDNTVGFTYSPKDNPPKMSASQYIWVEEIIDGWYLFRTT